MTQPWQQGPYGPPQQAPVMPPPPHQQAWSQPAPVPQGQALGWEARASKRAGFGTLVAVEFRKLAGTRSDKILLVAGPLFAILVTFSVAMGQDDLTTAKSQIMPLALLVRIADVVLHVTLIKLVAGEWQYRSVQPTLLMQPSRVRYALAQAVVVLAVWAGTAILEIGLYYPLLHARADAINHGFLLDHRFGWVLGVAVLGTGLTIAVALAIAMVLPNSAGAITVYVIAVLGLMILIGFLPEVVSWIDPAQPMMALAGVSRVTSTGSVITSSVMIVLLFGYGLWSTARRDAG
jgi:hypothetical protein